MANPNPFVVAYCSLDVGRRQLSTFVDTNTTFKLLKFIHDLDGTQYDDWWQLRSSADVDRVIAKANSDLGGLSYDLPVAMGKQESMLDPYLVAYFSPDNRMQLSALRDVKTKIDLISFIHDLDGTSYDNWFQLRSGSDVDQIMKKTVNDLEGVVYNLRPRK
ncbi:hypothetical protein [Nocardia pneumoniae]|uniref:hypothetical protein n=1 Tax=Nocardia pneumoniae TaxID=228601 RepID=UPI0003009FEC|nr:hypothetical protein [Nocardia pneumoniae]